MLAAQTGVSKTPIGEALRRLEAEGFIKVDPHPTPEVRRLEPDLAEQLITRHIQQVRDDLLKQFA